MENKDFIDRKVVGIEKLFELVMRDVKSLVIVLSLGVNLYLGHKVIKTNEEMRKAVIDEVRRQVPSAVRTETNEQMMGINSKIDTVLVKSREAIGVIKELKDE